MEITTEIINFTDTPEYLKQREQWVVYGRRTEKGIDAFDEDGKLNKEPFNPKTKGHAQSTNPSTWSSFKEEVKVYGTGYFNGIRFAVRPKDNLVSIDLDHVLNSNLVPHDDAQEIISRFKNAYIEISPSGDGFHIYCFGPAICCSKGSYNKWIELYSRAVNKHLFHCYFCVPGHRISETFDITSCWISLAWLYKTYKKEIEVSRPVIPTPILKTINSERNILKTSIKSRFS